MYQHTKFLVHLMNREGASVPARFGNCLLDQLTELSDRKCEELTSNISQSLGENFFNDPSTNSKKEINVLGVEKKGLYQDVNNIVPQTLLDPHACSIKLSWETNFITLMNIAHKSVKIQNEATYTLRHSEFCPARLQHQQDRQHPEHDNGLETEDLTDRGNTSHTSSNNDKISQGIAVGVSVLVQSKDGKVLLTRRAKHMRTFPGAWVPPGGHVEVGESMEAAGSRELLEETGVALSPGNPVEVLGMWESVYPPVLGLGHPVRQHLVVYLLALLPLPADSIQVQLQAKEVDAGVWLNCEQVSLMLHRGEKETMPSTTAQTLPAIVVNKAGESVPGEVNTLRFRQPVANETEGPRITSGTRYALALWLDRCRKNQHKADQPSFSANL